MGTPVAVLGDQITGVCPLHQIPNPASGIPQPGPPMPFTAPVVSGAVSNVLVGGKPVLVVGATGNNTPPHVGLHVSDPFMAPPTQRGVIVSGSARVLAGGKPVATAASSVTLCAGTPGTLVASGVTVLVGA